MTPPTQLRLAIEAIYGRDCQPQVVNLTPGQTTFPCSCGSFPLRQFYKDGSGRYLAGACDTCIAKPGLKVGEKVVVWGVV